MMPFLSQVARRIGWVFARDRPQELGVPLRQSLYTRIGFGYILAIGIGTLGSLTGLLVADVWQGRNLDRLFWLQDKSSRLGALQAAIANAEAQALRLDVYPRSTRKRQIYLEAFEREVSDAIEQIATMQVWIDESPAWVFENEPEFERILVNYSDTINRYRAAIVNHFSTFDPEAAVRNEDMLRLTLERLVRSPDLNWLDFYYDEVESMRQQNRQKVREHSEAVETIQGFEKTVISLSILVSACVAGVLAWRATRKIVNPIADTAAVAQQAARKRDYSLRAPIVTEDETVRLAASLNYLIERVEQQTRELRESEQEARERNVSLKAALAELADTQSQLVQSEKMSSLGQLVAGVAHEINNPVNFIHGNITHARDYVSDILGVLAAYQHRYPHDDEIEELAEDIDLEFTIDDLLKIFDSLSSGTTRIRDIVKSLRTFSRLDEAEFKEVDLHEGIDSTLLMLSSRLKAKPDCADIQVETDYGELPLVSCYANQVNQVVMNLMANAIDAIEDAAALGHWNTEDSTSRRPKIVIRTRPQGDAVEIQIADNAMGIPEEARSKLFDPFFTTKDVGRGTGLGLSICYKIVTETHGGQLDFHSTIGRGTTFRIVLPLAHDSPTPQPAIAKPLDTLAEQTPADTTT